MKFHEISQNCKNFSDFGRRDIKMEISQRHLRLFAEIRILISRIFKKKPKESIRSKL